MHVCTYVFVCEIVDVYVCECVHVHACIFVYKCVLQVNVRFMCMWVYWIRV